MREDTPGSTLGSWSLDGALAGSCIGLGFTGVRWATDEPYVPVMMAYDVALGALCFAAVFAVLSRLRGPRARRSARWMSALAVSAVPAYAWREGLRLSDPGAAIKWLALAIVGLSLVAAAHAWFRGRERGLPPTWIAAVLGLAAVASVVTGWMRPGGLLVFPTALLAVLLPGIPRRSGRAGRRWIAVVGACAAFGLATTQSPASGALVPQLARPALGDGPAVILIVIDTLRRDHLSLYGYERATTPMLDRWAQGALVFDEAISASSWTLPSHATLFTGLYPRSHGAHGMRGESRKVSAIPLASEFTTVAERLRDAGYATAGVASNFAYLDPTWGLDQGFETYWVEQPHPGLRGIPAVDGFVAERHPYSMDMNWSYYRDRWITDNAIRWMESAAGGPFFLFVNYMDVHSPSGRPPDTVAPGPVLPLPPKETFERDVLKGAPLDPEIRRALIDVYDRELSHLDGELDRLLTWIDARGIGQSSLVIVTSDHGQYFGEHSLLFHSKHLHDPVIRVPLIVRAPGVEPGRTSRPSHGVDVAPTILAFVGLSSEALPGASLLSEARAPMIAEWHPAEFPFFRDPMFEGRFDHDLWALREGAAKLFLDDRGHMELYLLDEDSGEERDRTAELPRVAAAMRDRIEAWKRQNPLPAPGVSPPDSDEVREHLRGLGYAE